MSPIFRMLMDLNLRIPPESASNKDDKSQLATQLHFIHNESWLTHSYQSTLNVPAATTVLKLTRIQIDRPL